MANISKEVNIEMLEKLPDGSYKKKNPATKASQVKLEDSKFRSNTVEAGMSELFTNVSNGKDLVGGAITGVDDSVVIPADPTFGDLANAIGSISTGKKWASGVGKTGYDTFFEVRGLDFTPNFVIWHNAGFGVFGLISMIMQDDAAKQYLSQVNILQDNNSRRKVIGGNEGIFSDGFRVAFYGWVFDDVNWIAFE